MLAKLNARLAPFAVEILGFRIGISQLQMHEQLQNFGMREQFREKAGTRKVRRPTDGALRAVRLECCQDGGLKLRDGILK